MANLLFGKSKFKESRIKKPKAVRKQNENVQQMLSFQANQEILFRLLAFKSSARDCITFLSLYEHERKNFEYEIY